MKITLEIKRVPPEDEEEWIARCLELDLIAYGVTPADAVAQVAKAMNALLLDESATFHEPWEGTPPEWERAYKNIASEVSARSTTLETALPDVFSTPALER